MDTSFEGLQLQPLCIRGGYDRGVGSGLDHGLLSCQKGSLWPVRLCWCLCMLKNTAFSIARRNIAVLQAREFKHKSITLYPSLQRIACPRDRQTSVSSRRQMIWTSRRQSWCAGVAVESVTEGDYLFAATCERNGSTVPSRTSGEEHFLVSRR